MAVAVLGLHGLRGLLYISKPYLPQKIADGLGGFYTRRREQVLHRRTLREALRQAADRRLDRRFCGTASTSKVIDDTVNNAADGARHVSDEVRHMQSGNLRSYAGWIAAGGAVVIAYMIWMGVR